MLDELIRLFPVRESFLGSVPSVSDASCFDVGVVGLEEGGAREVEPLCLGAGRRFGLDVSSYAQMQ